MPKINCRQRVGMSPPLIVVSRRPSRCSDFDGGDKIQDRNSARQRDRQARPRSTRVQLRNSERVVTRTVHSARITGTRSRGEDRAHSSGTAHSYHVFRAASPGARGRRATRSGKHPSRRSRRHRAAQWAADGRVVSRRGGPGTSAPLNPASRDYEFRFHFEDTGAARGGPSACH
jgi:hypothetical protein